jgi:hypothetical protein
MADTTVTIAASGADYTTISAALAVSDVSSGAYIMQITDTRNYGALTADDTLNFEATTGTPTQANRLILEADANSRHSGVFELHTATSHAKLMSQTVSTIRPYNLVDSYTEIRYMHVGHVTGFDIFRVTGTDCLFSRCLFYIDNPASSDPAFFFRPTQLGTHNLYLDNCVFCDIGRLIDFDSDANQVTFNLYVDHCGIETMGSANVDIFDVRFNTQEFVALNIYLNNSWLEATSASEYEGVNSGENTGCSVNYYGAYNVGDKETPFPDTHSTDNTTNYEYASGGYTDVTTVNDAIIVTSHSTNSKHTSNMTPQVATGAGSNQLLGYAANRIGLEPDSRQDFSTDIIGNPRAAKAGFIDVGPFQITEAPASGFKYWNGSTWADSVSVKYYNGTAWADVTAVKYWNGSTWADPV